MKEEVVKVKCEYCEKEFEQVGNYQEKLCPVCKYLVRLPKYFRSNDFYDSECLKPYVEKGIFLCGYSGSGKTVFLIEVLKETMKQGKGGTYVNIPELLSETKYNDDKYKLINDYKRVKGMVFFDEIMGVGNPTAYVLDCIYQILDYRHINELPTCLASNLTLEDIERIDARIATRISRLCGDNIFKLDTLPKLKHCFKLKDKK